MASRRSKSELAAATALAAASRPLGVRGYRVRDVARAAERRSEILLGAARAFSQGGYDATNMDQIARECGLAKGHIYHYFRSKEEIFTEIRIETVVRALDRLKAVAPLARKDPELALRKAIAGVIAGNFEDGQRYEAALSSPVSLSEENKKRIRTMGRRFEQIFMAIVRRGMERGIFVAADPKLTTFVILRGAFTVTDWYRAGGRWKPQWIIEQVTEQLVRSVLPTTE
jgi:AcrR family transcriptional regulator